MKTLLPRSRCRFRQHRVARGFKVLQVSDILDFSNDVADRFEAKLSYWVNRRFR